MDQITRSQVQVRLRSLRPVLQAEPAQTRLRLFDEFMEHHEFGLALDAVCDFVLGPDSPEISFEATDQIKHLRALMGLERTFMIERLKSAKRLDNAGKS